MVCWVQRGQESKRSFLGKGDHPCKSVGEQQSAVRGQCCSSLPPHPISILPSVLTTTDTEQGGNRLSQRSRSPSLPCGYKWPVKWFQITRPSGALLGVLQQDGSLVIEGQGHPFLLIASLFVLKVRGKQRWGSHLVTRRHSGG